MLHRLRYSARFVVALIIAAAFISPVAAQDKFEFWPGANYDPRIPTFKQVLGYDPGERITPHAGLMRYMEALAAAAPNQVKIFEYARSWEGRKLIYVAVGSEANIRQLDAIRAGMQKLADPRKTPEAEARSLIASLPAVVWLGYGVHGNEISSPDAALLTAYHLLAARNDPVVEEILAKTIILIDPTQNPDGRDRFVHNFEVAEGLEPDASPLAAEHNEPWPGGRTNHYYFDMNRDWFALTQPESRGRVRVLQEWYPLVFVDLHEMGSNSTYYFAPEAVPYNPHLAKDQRAALDLFGRNNAKWFDRFGFSYFTREVYDAFYPGYGASWPSYYGAVAMTYEQASVRGLVVRRSDQTTMHFRDSVRHHFVASVSTAETAARNRETLLANFYRYRQSAIEEGSRENIRAYILPRRGDASAVDKLAHILDQQGVEIKRAAASFRACGAEYPAGSYIISLAQPAKRLIRTLLDVHVPMEEEFIKEQERRRRKKLPDEIYDVTAWSVPLQYNVESVACAEDPRGNFEAVKPVLIPPGRLMGGEGTVAYLVPWGTAASGRLLAAALREGLRIYSADKTITQQGRTYPRGTLIFRTKENPANLRQTLERLAAQTGADVHATDTGWVEEGVNFGSGNVVYMRRPRIALAWDTPTGAGSAGATRFVLERQFGYPVTVIRTRQLAGADLSGFDVLILPDAGFGGYASVFGTEGIRQLKDWVASGGVVIALGSGAVSFLADSRTGLLDTAQEMAARDGKPAAKPEAAKPDAAKPAEAPARTEQPPAPARPAGKILASEEDYLKAIQADTEPPDVVPGVLVKAQLDRDHWITAGLGDTVYALFQGRAIFSPVKLDKGVNAAVFAGPDELLASGHLWEENRKQLAYKPLVIVQNQGRGVVVGFTADPNFRAYMDGLNVLFLNAIFRGAAHAQPAVQ
ncbi:MAG TPA: M14 family metallopeptidase [Blastocatellia bacterium]|nr:M14 family metallopeptidase [Blastocatellia bacterium]